MKELAYWFFILISISLLTIACAEPNKEGIESLRSKIENSATLRDLRHINDSLRQENQILKQQLGIYE